MTAYVQRTSNPGFAPERVEAIQWTGSNVDEIRENLPEIDVYSNSANPDLIVDVDSGTGSRIKRGDWVFRTDSGYTCAMFRRHFEERYRPADTKDDKECTDLRCSRIDGRCVGMHCPRCGEPCGSQGHRKCRDTKEGKQ